VQRPHEAVAFTEKQGAVLPLQQHKAPLGLHNEALAERLEIENNRAGEAGIAWTGCDQTYDGKEKAIHQRLKARRSFVIAGPLTMLERTPRSTRR